jgi:hypothetical protein
MPGRNQNIDKVSIRMYCMGTGDCFVLKFFAAGNEKFTMMIDCGSCRGDAHDFGPYLMDLKEYVKERGVDLLVVSHEHQDHVNGFYTRKDIFSDIAIRKAWFGWPEDPDDPTGKAKELLDKRRKLRRAFTDAKKNLEEHRSDMEKNLAHDHCINKFKAANNAFFAGLDTLAEINLPAGDEPDEKGSLAGMAAIRVKLKNDNVKPGYLEPGDVIKLDEAPGLNFYVLGPPWERDAIFKDGKEGTDVYKKYFSSNQSMLSADTFGKIGKLKSADLPFDPRYALDDSFTPTRKPGPQRKYELKVKELIDGYRKDPHKSWRRIDYDWITGVGSLALRLDSHLNNTSLALAIECEESGNVLLFPGDAEFGNWESWHLIKKWDKKGKNGKHLTEDLLNRTVFYKVGHHLSYNGTALEKGIEMMPLSGMSSMASLDRTRISKNWKSTMPNALLLQNLIKRCNGGVFIMSEDEITAPPSLKADPAKIAGYECHADGLYKQYTFTF